MQCSFALGSYELGEIDAWRCRDKAMEKVFPGLGRFRAAKLHVTPRGHVGIWYKLKLPSKTRVDLDWSGRFLLYLPREH